MKIGIITFHQSHFKYNQRHNFGALLQTFALKKVLSMLPNTSKVDVIKYVPEIDYHKKNRNYFYIVKQTPSYIIKLKTVILLLLSFPKKYIRRKRNVSFIKQYLGMTDVLSKNQLFCSDYKIFVFGSDQIWNKNIIGYYDDVLFGNFEVQNNVKKIAYAASGNIDLKNQSEVNHFKSSLLKFEAISVREEFFSDKLRGICKKDIHVTLDPTLLIDKQEYLKIAKFPKIKEKYLLVYSLSGVPDSMLAFANCIAKKNNLIVKIISFLSDKWRKQKNIIETASPERFIGWISDAEYVVTNSFHGTTLSIVFNKNFYTFLKDSETDHRIINLLTKLNIRDRAVNNHQDLKNQKINIIDWTDVNNRLIEEKVNSMEFLQNSIFVKKNVNNYT